MEKYNKKPLKWSMMIMLTLGWLLPLFLIAVVMMYFMGNQINNQLERTITTSAEKAAQICVMHVESAITASKDASYLETIRNSYLEYQVTGNKHEINNQVIRFLEQHYRYNKSFLNTVLFLTEEPDMLYYTSYDGRNNDAYKISLRYQNEVISEAKKISQTLDTGIALVNINERVYMMRNMMLPSYEPFAMLIMELDKDVVFGSLESTWGYVNSEIYLNGELLVSSSPKVISIPDIVLTDAAKEFKLVKTGGEYWTYANKQEGLTQISYAILLDKSVIVDDAQTTRYIGMLLLIFMLPLIYMVFRFFHERVTAPIKELVEGAYMLEKGKYGYTTKNKWNSKEFAYLGEAFNSMSMQLKYQFETIYMEELALKDARIMALQSQINPHFLNNTLEIINWEARIQENYKVSQMIENLSIMLEATMDRRHRRFVTLAEEMSYVDAYLFIISQRLGERMTVEKSVDKSLFHVKVPRLIIQPIVENAIEHGIEGKIKGKLTLRVYEQADNLLIEIRNTGLMSEQDLEKIALLLQDDYEAAEMGSTSIGIRNVNRRLRIIYGEECKLSLKNNENGETVSTIIIKIDHDNNKRQ